MLIENGDAAFFVSNGMGIGLVIRLWLLVGLNGFCNTQTVLYSLIRLLTVSCSAPLFVLDTKRVDVQNLKVN